MALVFQYGSNLSSSRLNSDDRLRGVARVYSVAQTHMQFDIWSRKKKWAAADIVEGEGRNFFWGVIYDVLDFLIRKATAGTRKSLDEIEDEGGNYSRIEIALQDRDGNPIPQAVITYIGRDRRKSIFTAQEYVHHILAGIKEHSLPQEYQQYVIARIVENNPVLRSILPQH